MLAAPRPPKPSAIDRLLAAPQRFEFQQAVRLLRRWLGARARGPAPALRFRNPLSLAFPASEIAALDRRPDPTAAAPLGHPATDVGVDETAAVPERYELTPAFMGMLGVQGTLPLAYTEQIMAREVHQRDGAARAFLDIFQHRAVSLFHDAWRKHRLPLQFEDDRQFQYRPLVLSLAGLGMPGLTNRLQAQAGGVADDALAYYAGLLQQRVVGARHLQAVLSDYFGVPVRLREFMGRWFALERSNRSVLGQSQVTLGRDTLVGERVWQRDLRAQLTIGPMTHEQHRRFLPGGPGERALKAFLNLATGTGVEYEVRLRLQAEHVPAAQLGDAPASAAQLGWNSFLLSGPSQEDREESAYVVYGAT